LRACRQSGLASPLTLCLCVWGGGGIGCVAVCLRSRGECVGRPQHARRRAVGGAYLHSWAASHSITASGLGINPWRIWGVVHAHQIDPTRSSTPMPTAPPWYTQMARPTRPLGASSHTMRPPQPRTRRLPRHGPAPIHASRVRLDAAPISYLAGPVLLSSCFPLTPSPHAWWHRRDDEATSRVQRSQQTLMIAVLRQ